MQTSQDTAVDYYTKQACHLYSRNVMIKLQVWALNIGTDCLQLDEMQNRDQSSGILGPRVPGPWSSGPQVLRSLGPRVLRSLGPRVLRSPVPGSTVHSYPTLKGQLSSTSFHLHYQYCILITILSIFISSQAVVECLNSQPLSWFSYSLVPRLLPYRKTGREPGRFNHVPRDVQCVVLCVVLIIKLLPTHSDSKYCPVL